MIRVSEASAISAPAEIARWLTNAMVRTGALRSVSRIATAASTRPPNVFMSSSTAAAPASSASRLVRDRNGARPRSLMPSIEMTYTTEVDGWASALRTSAVPVSARRHRAAQDHAEVLLRRVSQAYVIDSDSAIRDLRGTATISLGRVRPAESDVMQSGVTASPFDVVSRLQVFGFAYTRARHRRSPPSPESQPAVPKSSILLLQVAITAPLRGVLPKVLLPPPTQSTCECTFWSRRAIADRPIPFPTCHVLHRASSALV